MFHKHLLYSRRECSARRSPPDYHYSYTGNLLALASASAVASPMVAKDGNSVYREGRRSDCWLKVKANLRQEAVIGGFTRPNGSRQHFGALVLGLWEDGELIHIGEVGGGFSAQTLASVFAQLEPLVQSRCPFQMKPKTNEPATWVRPELVCEVRFAAWTGGHLRHPIFVGMRGGER